ncbi:MAG TPA: hypothetical protein PKK85_08375 [Methanobacteriaceae archaeon]|nr:hypothetical protein [Methanobacteriaceae archaeon]
MSNCQAKDRETGEIIDLGTCQDKIECLIRLLEYANRLDIKGGNQDGSS